VKQDAIAARYENGELRITLPKKEGAKKAAAAKHISVQ
jgi:HSP20 family protein